jgi:cbb3-type cytochrome oxidase subunit 3
MIRDVLQIAGETTWVQIGLILCFLLFIGIVVWTYLGRKNRYEHELNLPLDDGTDDGKHLTHSKSSETSSKRK